jgi:8-oxo-dGTP pyrophosphatase MutT (NUDIX family)
MITLFFKDKPVLLCDEPMAMILLKESNKNSNIKKITSPSAVEAFFKESNNAEFDGGILFNESFEMVKSLVFNHFIIIEAAGGVVINNLNEYLFIYRREKWDLPKGKLEKNESIEQCAQREIEEETGICNLNLQREITKTYHIYEENNRQILKISHWFLYNINNLQEGQPQQEEDISIISWFPKNELNIPLSNTYSNIQIVMNQLSDTI